jgi:hypothetical protein
VVIQAQNGVCVADQAVTQEVAYDKVQVAVRNGEAVGAVAYVEDDSMLEVAEAVAYMEDDSMLGTQAKTVHK